MACTASFSTNALTESSGYRVSTRPDLSRISEPRVAQSADESRTVDRRAADRQTADRRATIWWSADGWPND